MNPSGVVAKLLGSRTCDQQVAVRIPAAALPSATWAICLYTRASVIKQYNLVPANGR